MDPAYINIGLNLAMIAIMIAGALLIWRAVGQNTTQIRLNRDAIIANTDAMLRKGRS